MPEASLGFSTTKGVAHGVQRAQLDREPGPTREPSPSTERTTVVPPPDGPLTSSSVLPDGVSSSPTITPHPVTPDGLPAGEDLPTTTTTTTTPTRPSRPLRLAAAGLAVLAALVAVVIALDSVTKTAAGEVAVIRNGGPLDNNLVRQIVPPASSVTWTGLFSTAHRYPATQRFYKISADPKRADSSGVDVEFDPTSDGVEIGMEGTVYFTLNTDPVVLKSFDDKYGTRTYRGLDGSYRAAWEGDEGWSTFLDAVVRPVISNDLREEIGSFRCAELQAACALVQNSASAAQAVKVGSSGNQNNTNIAKIQQAINASLKDDFTQTLGGPFISDIRFNLVKITLPEKIQSAINDAQAAFAQITQAQARIMSAEADAKANAQRQKGYEQCPACAQIDLLKAIPPTVTTFAPGSGFAITAPQK